MEFQKFQIILEKIPNILEKGTLACADHIAELFRNRYDDTDIQIIDEAITAWKSKNPTLTPTIENIRDIFELMR